MDIDGRAQFTDHQQNLQFYQVDKVADLLVVASYQDSLLIVNLE